MVRLGSARLSPDQQQCLIEKSEAFKIHGHDKHGRKILRIIGKFFPSREVSVDAVIKYLEEKIYTRLGKKELCVVYIHTDVQRADKVAGITALREVYESVPTYLKENLTTVHFVHPDLQTRLFFATCGRLLFGEELYGKLSYVTRLDQLWDHVRRAEIEIPKFVFDREDDDLKYHPVIDYGLESDQPRSYTYSSLDPMDSNTLYTYSLRSIS